MAEYIEREALLEAIACVFFKTDPAGVEQIGVLSCHRVVREFPAADVAHVVHGRWIPVSNTGIGATGRCTVCNQAIYGFTAYNYCPNCGAHMKDGE